MANISQSKKFGDGIYSATEVDSAISTAVAGGSLPTQTGNNGKYLTTNGTIASWSVVEAGDALPTQTGNNGKYLTTDGNNPVWATVSASDITYSKEYFTGTAGQTDFTKTYDVGYVDVYINGIKIPSAEFTATNGTSIVLSTAVNEGDIVEIISYTNIGSIAGLPIQTGNTGKFLSTDGTNSTWETISITESQISDLGSYSPASHTHTESEISDLGTYAPQATTYTKTEVDTALSGVSGGIDFVAIAHSIEQHTTAGTWIPTTVKNYGTGTLTNSAGTFSFPRTGLYEVAFNGQFENTTGATAPVGQVVFNATTLYSSMGLASTSVGNLLFAGNAGSIYTPVQLTQIFNVTNVSTHTLSISLTLNSISSMYRGYMTVKRLGESL